MVRQVGTGEAFFIRQEIKHREQGERKTSPTSRITSLQEGKQTVNGTKRHTETEGDRGKKDSGTRPLLLGPLGARGKASPLRIRLMRSPTG